MINNRVRVIAIVLMVILSLQLTSCGSQEEIEQSSINSTPDYDSTEEESIGTDDKVITIYDLDLNEYEQFLMTYMDNYECELAVNEKSESTSEVYIDVIAYVNDISSVEFQTFTSSVLSAVDSMCTEFGLEIGLLTTRMFPDNEDEYIAWISTNGHEGRILGYYDNYEFSDHAGISNLQEIVSRHIDSGDAAGTYPIRLGETIVLEWAEFSIDNVEWVDRIAPTNTSGVYTYYDAKEDFVYLVLWGTWKNTSADSYDVSKIVSQFILNDTYNYSGNSEREDNNKNGFTIYHIQPLQSSSFIIFTSVPIEMQEQFKEGIVRFGFNNNMSNNMFDSLDGLKFVYELAI